MRRYTAPVLFFLIILLITETLCAGCTAPAAMQPACGVENITDLFPRTDDNRHYEARVLAILSNDTPNIGYYFRNHRDYQPTVLKMYFVRYNPDSFASRAGAPLYDLSVFEFNSAQNATWGMQIVWDDYSVRLAYPPNDSIVRNNLLINHFEVNFSSIAGIAPPSLHEHYFFWHKDRLGFILTSSTMSNQTDLYNDALDLIDTMMSVCVGGQGTLQNGTFVPSIGIPQTTTTPRMTSITPCIVPESVVDVGNLRIDPEVIKATPYWVDLLAGRADQQDLIDYIDRANVSAEKKIAWTTSLQKYGKNILQRYEKKKIFLY